MEFDLFQLDAFTGAVFGGNPAAVVLVPAELPESTMHAIARETGMPATAFVRPTGGGFALRWFTPEIELDLCGHATLASGAVLFARGDAAGEAAVFASKAGELRVIKDGDRFALDFPARPGRPVDAGGPLASAVAAALGATPRMLYEARDVMAVFEREEEVATLRPDSAAIARIETFGVIATAPAAAGLASASAPADFVSRFFAPRAGIAEDPATGSSHCTLVPYWSRRLGKRELVGRQLSARGGEMFCKDDGERVSIGGRVVEFLRGRITI